MAIKRCCSCGKEVLSGYAVCSDCHNRYPAFGMEWRQTGLKEITIFVPENITIKIAPFSSGRKFTAQLRKLDFSERARETWKNIKKRWDLLTR